jgi:SsrA-binding protein
MKVIANNKKAFHNYFIEDKFEAGIVLEGWEVKSIRAAEVNLADSFVYFENGNAFLRNAHIAQYQNGRVEEQNSHRDRGLLLKRSQIDKLYTAVKQKGFTCVVTKVYLTKVGLVKVEIALARGKHTYDKKQSLKEKDIKREAEREVRKIM